MNFPKVCLVTALACSSLACSAQSMLIKGATSTPEAADPAAIVTAQPAAPKAAKPLFSRWLDLTELSHSERYRGTFDTNGAVLFKDGQERTAVAGRFKLDTQGRYFVGFRMTSGRFFNWSFADYIGHDFHYYAWQSAAKFTPAETAAFVAAMEADPQATTSQYDSNSWRMSVRDLYVSATPIRQATVEFGSIPIERGYSTEATTFDDDGYTTGERLRLNDPKHVYVDEIAYTSAYLGDILTPSFFARGERLGESNYRQLSARKLLLHKEVGVSGEYNWLLGTKTLREAVEVKPQAWKGVDTLRAEFYQRVNDITLQQEVFARASGFAASAGRKAGRITGDVGYADIDHNYGCYTGSRFLSTVGFSLNGDTYNTGKRAFTHGSIRLTDSLSAYGYFSHTVAGNDYTLTRQVYTGGMKLDLKALINSGQRPVF